MKCNGYIDDGFGPALYEIRGLRLLAGVVRGPNELEEASGYRLRARVRLAAQMSRSFKFFSHPPGWNDFESGLGAIQGSEVFLSIDYKDGRWRLEMTGVPQAEGLTPVDCERLAQLTAEYPDRADAWGHRARETPRQLEHRSGRESMDP